MWTLALVHRNAASRWGEFSYSGPSRCRLDCIPFTPRQGRLNMARECRSFYYQGDESCHTSPRAGTAAYHYCSAEAASHMCEKGPGLDRDCNITTSSPSDLRWEQHAGGTFRTYAGESLWGINWEQEHIDDLHSCLVIGVPSSWLQNQTSPGRQSKS